MNVAVPQMHPVAEAAAVLELLPGVLDSQLRRDAELTHYEYYVMAMLSEAPKRTLRMTALARRTNATLPRLSHVVKRLEELGVEVTRSLVGSYITSLEMQGCSVTILKADDEMIDLYDAPANTVAYRKGM